MKFTKKELNNIIKEEANKVFNENRGYDIPSLIRMADSHFGKDPYNKPMWDRSRANVVRRYNQGKDLGGLQNALMAMLKQAGAKLSFEESVFSGPGPLKESGGIGIQLEVDPEHHQNRSVTSFFKVMFRNHYYKEELARLYHLMISDPEEAKKEALELQQTVGRPFTPGLISFHQRGLTNINPNSVPTKEQMLSAVEAKVKAYKDAEEKARANREPDTRDMADRVYPRDSRGKIIGRAD